MLLRTKKNLLVKCSKAYKLTVMDGIIFGFSPLMPNSGKNLHRGIIEKFIKIWHSNSNFEAAKAAET